MILEIPHVKTGTMEHVTISPQENMACPVNLQTALEQDMSYIKVEEDPEKCTK